MLELNLMQRIAVWALPVLFAITVHEVAHGWVARRLGDPTAMMMGRLTLNPIKHIDPIGTILVPTLLMLSPVKFLFGWAKPVPVTWENLRNPKRDMALVAVAGPFANVLMALFWGACVQLGGLAQSSSELLPVAIYLVYAGVAGLFINGILMALNLLPIPPLDGGRIVAGILPGHLSYQFSRIEPYGFIILIALLITNVLGYLLTPVLVAFYSILQPISGLTADQVIGIAQSLIS